jgi:hypothetical protein
VTKRYPDWMKRHPDWIAKVERGGRNMVKDAERRDSGETCERCGKDRREGAWVQFSPATHDSPADYGWVCEQCSDRDDIERRLFRDR